MSQITTVGINSEYESSLVFANDESTVQFLLEKIPQMGATMIIDKEGNLIRNTISKSFESKIDPHEIENIAKLIGLRYRFRDWGSVI
ncbi:MAG: hypothetical protein IIA83_03825 [Thaumarchaeota archaeon]|nr:hypothetical protein [Nitrososphaerota archaeon]